VQPPRAKTGERIVEAGPIPDRRAQGLQGNEETSADYLCDPPGGPENT